MKKKMISVLLVDDHQLFIDGMRSILDDNDDIFIAGEANNGGAVLEFLETDTVDVIVMDIEMPEVNGIEATRIIKKKYPNIKVLILTMYNESEFIVNLMGIGANGYILKNKSKEELVSAIHNVYRGNAHYSLEVLNQATTRPATKSIPLTELSSREIEVLTLVASGMTTKEIASELHIADATVSTHRRSLLHKLDVPNDKHLVRYAIRHNLIEA